MIVEQLWTANAYRNFNYLVVCPETGEALAIDPVDPGKVLDRAKDRGWTIRQIFNTHEHADHTGGNEAIRAATGARVLAHAGARDRISGLDLGLGEGDVVKVGPRVELEALDTPGHTLTHLCLLGHGDTPALFCGDTLFNAGAGNCLHGGDPGMLYRTFAERLALLPEATLLYPGHDYLENNLGFTLDREPDNAAARTLLAQVETQDPGHRPASSLGLEKEINAFFRLHSPSLRARLREAIPSLPAHPEDREVFLALRELRNGW